MTETLKLNIPVECQNGHKAFWRMDIVGLEAKHHGVTKEEACDCNKTEFGQGYSATGMPEIMNESY